MRSNRIRELWDQGKPVVNSWLTIDSSYSAELIAGQGFDSITVDLQHGMIDFQTAVAMLQAISSTLAVPLARVPGNDPPTIMRLLDAGAYGIICPMINNRDECERFVTACRYPPVGERSFGPARGLLYGGPDYFDQANATILTFAMIETREGIENMDAILAVEGLDAVFVGPNDLALALDCPPLSESTEQSVVETIDRILTRARCHGVKTGIFCSSGQAARDRIKHGFDFVTPGSDANMLAGTARAAVAKTRGEE